VISKYEYKCLFVIGKWIVRSEYVEKCYKARKWLPAEMFPLKPGSHSGNAKKLSEVPNRWRDYRVTNGNQGPFKSWTVLLALPEVDRIRYKRYGLVEIVVSRQLSIVKLFFYFCT